MKNIREGGAALFLVTALFLLYIFGIYKIIVDDHRYTTKDVAIAFFVPPYRWWVGGKEVYRISTTTPEERALEQECLDSTEALGLGRKARLRFCECIVETRNVQQCKYRIRIK